MSKYPTWWNSTITIYNQYKDPTTKVTKWYKTILSNCFWKRVGDKVVIDKSILDTSNLVCRIPKNTKYVEPRKWVQLPNDRMPSKFTLQLNDIIVLGKCQDEINEYTQGKHSNDLLNKYKGECLVIGQISIDTSLGLDNPHYRVTGD